MHTLSQIFYKHCGYNISPGGVLTAEESIDNRVTVVSVEGKPPSYETHALVEPALSETIVDSIVNANKKRDKSIIY